MILVVALGDGQPQSSLQGPFVLGGFVVSMERNRCGVIVQLIAADGEFVHGMSCDVQGQRRDVGVEELVKATANAIIVER